MVIQVKYQDAPTAAQNEPILIERVGQLLKQSIMIVEQLELVKSDVRHDMSPASGVCGHNASPMDNTLDYVTTLIGEKHQRALELLREISEWV